MKPTTANRTVLKLEQLERRELLAADMLELALASTGTPGDEGAEFGNDSSLRPAISADGRYVAFHSSANNLVPDDSNDATDVFLKDMWTGVLRLVSTAEDGMQGDLSASPSSPSISAGGRYVAFASRATNLVSNDSNGSLSDIFVKDMQTGAVTLASQYSNGEPSPGGAYSPALTPDGRSVAYIGDDGVYVKNLQTGVLTLVDEGYFWEVSISDDGRYVCYDDDAAVFVKDLQTGEITLVSTDASGAEGNSWSFFSTISANGQYVAFGSYASNLVPDDANGSTADIFVKELATGMIRLASGDAEGNAGDDAAFRPALSADGRYVAFQSYASNLVPEDSNGIGSDIFLKDLQTNEVTLVSATAEPTTDNRSRSRPAISANGRFVAFDSRADGHVPGDTGRDYDVFRADLHTGMDAAPGNLSVEIHSHPQLGNVLVLTGGAGNNNVQLSSPALGVVHVEGRMGTTIGGLASSADFVGIDAIEIDLGDGDDSLSAQDVWITGSLVVDIGDGENRVDVLDSVLGGLGIEAGSGWDRVAVERTTILGDSRIRLHKGDDVLRIVDSVFGDDVLLDGGQDEDVLALLGANSFADKEKVKRFEWWL